MVKSDFQISFWGVRGSLPVPGPDTVYYGGNTSCVQVQIKGRLFILDAGTGIHKLGQHLVTTNPSLSADIFISHTHWDHIQGFPFFAPAFVKGNHFTLYGPSRANHTFADSMKYQMRHDYFPVNLDQMGASIDFRELQSGAFLNLDDGITVKTLQNHHPGGSLSYRFDYDGCSCCYMTDTEHYPEPNHSQIGFAQGADVVIYDSNFTEAEYEGTANTPSRKGWGHSTWQEGIKLAKAAGAKKLVLFHHANYRTDADMREIELQAQKHYSDLLAAREGMIISI